jgi:hypothetical protein
VAKDEKSFVVQLASDAERGRLAGRVESLDSGDVASFASARGLLRFLRSALLASSSVETKSSPALRTDQKEREDP